MDEQHTVMAECSEFASRIQIYRDKLSASERRIAEYMLANESQCYEMSIYDMAKEIGTSVATITRFCQTLGYRGLGDLKFHLEQGAVALVSEDMGIRKGDSINLIKQKATQYTQHSIQECILNADNVEFERAIEAISRSEILLFSAIGSASGIAATAVGMFLSVGVTAAFVPDTLVQMRTAATLKKGDVLLAISYDGYAKDSGDMLMMAKQRGATTILLTSCRETLLTSYADIVLYTPARSTGNALSITATAMCQLAVIQTLIIGVATMNYDHLLKKSNEQLHLTELKRYAQNQSTLKIDRVRQ